MTLNGMQKSDRLQHWHETVLKRVENGNHFCKFQVESIICSNLYKVQHLRSNTARFIKSANRIEFKYTHVIK